MSLRESHASFAGLVFEELATVGLEFSTEPRSPLQNFEAEPVEPADSFHIHSFPESVAQFGTPAADMEVDFEEPPTSDQDLELLNTPPAAAAPAPRSDDSAMTMLHCLFAMVFAAATLGLLNSLGIVARSGSYCPASNNGYTMCEIWQDARSLLSFVLGAALCCVLTRDHAQACPPNGNPNETESIGKVQMYACLL